MMIITKNSDHNFPFNWVNLDYYPDSNAKRIEIYLKNEDDDIVDKLKSLFYNLFDEVLISLLVFNNSWWNFCIETWDYQKDRYDYSLVGKSGITKEYLEILFDSNIEFDYSGCCMCFNWDRFILIILKCVCSQQAPYSPIFFDKNSEFFFYFHHSGSIGFYYKDTNEFIDRMLCKAKNDYDVKF